MKHLRGQFNFSLNLWLKRFHCKLLLHAEVESWQNIFFKSLETAVLIM